MARKTNNKHRQKNLKIAAIVAGVILLVGAGLFYTSWKKDRDSKTAAVAQEQKKTQGDTTKSNTSTGGVVDNNAPTTTPTTSPQPTVTPQASTAAVTLASPADGALVANGTTLSGTATVATVQYRFKDADGLDVSTGALTVSGGKYSGSVAGLKVRTATGTLEVYNYNASGAEENWVKINVRYK
jgi:hypothetical protein